MSNPHHDQAYYDAINAQYATEDRYADAMIHADRLRGFYPPYDARLDRAPDGRLIADETAGRLKPKRDDFYI